jgi:hypothetical protein
MKIFLFRSSKGLEIALCLAKTGRLSAVFHEVALSFSKSLCAVNCLPRKTTGFRDNGYWPIV